MTNPREIIRGKIIIPAPGGLEMKIDKVQKFLKERGIEEVEKLLYTGINLNRKRLETLLEKGIAGRKRNSTFAHTADDMRLAYEMSEKPAVDYSSTKIARVVVYDPKMLTDESIFKKNDEGEEIVLGFWEYRPLKGKTFRDAIIGIIALKEISDY